VVAVSCDVLHAVCVKLLHMRKTAAISSFVSMSH
jgi:hypothetical protein